MTAKSTLKLFAPAALVMLLMPMPSFAASNSLSGMLGGASQIAISIVAIVGVGVATFLYTKNRGGQGSLKQVIASMLCAVLVIGLILVIANPSILEGMSQGIVTKGVNTASNVANEVLG